MAWRAMLCSCTDSAFHARLCTCHVPRYTANAAVDRKNVMPMRVLHERPRDSPPLLLPLLLSLLLLFALPLELEESEETLVTLAAGAGTIG